MQVQLVRLGDEVEAEAVMWLLRDEFEAACEVDLAGEGIRGPLLDRAYQYATRNGLADLSLRPLAAAIGSGPPSCPARRTTCSRHNAQSLRQPGGPWDDFARQTVEDWLAELARVQPVRRRSALGAAERTLALAVLRGALLDLLASGDDERTTAAVERHLKAMP